MNDSEKELAQSFCEMCGCAMDTALAYLKCCDWNVEGGRMVP